ncbi:MAG: ImmA/IrrE family metallo-endopeptidase [Clostridia bacterium]|nr:ImmA/IrrE family metallo-endopeptidase [Clostridia bacterium]
MYDYYGVYAACRDAAWRCHLDFNMRRLPIKLLYLTRLAGIRVICDSKVKELRQGEVGASIYVNGRWSIVYDDRMPICESRMVLAHELGHILLGHEYKYSDYRFFAENKKLKSEREADMFAIRLLAPACVLHELGALDTKTIAELCEIPEKAAQDRAKRMQILEKRSRFYQSELEKRVYENFREFIENSRQK